MAAVTKSDAVTTPNPCILDAKTIDWSADMEKRLPRMVLRGLKPARKLPVFVIGLSHTRSVYDVLKDDPDPRFGVLLIPKGKRSRLDEISPRLLSRFEPEIAVSMIGGNEHNLLGLIEQPEPFDFEEPSVPIMFEDRRIVPRAQVRAMLNLMLTGMLSKVRLLKRFYGKPTVHVASPPPIPDNEHLAQHLGAFAKSAGLEPRFTPAPIRLKLYRMGNQIVKEMCEAEGIHFIGPMEEALDENGFLAAPYRKADPTHANARYGAHVLDALRAYADAVSAGGAPHPARVTPPLESTS
ncbi:hypothetical protein L1787_00820 [Acuticoccus sp. M5D2P5]|uniref:hypothetical protein n=1 Tax=Acuticoccus kalidii TaxID=2910977 RepID=UPI001F2913A7|nr:hypothetical protein [Acuticoccus kalidii]MCF3931953.1 hypothetical protein [Acuticoccus kalidii]